MNSADLDISRKTRTVKTFTLASAAVLALLGLLLAAKGSYRLGMQLVGGALCLSAFHVSPIVLIQRPPNFANFSVRSRLLLALSAVVYFFSYFFPAPQA